MRSRSSDVERLLDELETSGQTVAAFAREHGIPAQRLYWARRKRRRDQTDEEAVAFGQLHVTGEGHDASGAVEVRLPGGVSILLTRDFDDVALRRVLGVLGSC